MSHVETVFLGSALIGTAQAVVCTPVLVALPQHCAFATRCTRLPHTETRIARLAPPFLWSIDATELVTAITFVRVADQRADLSACAGQGKVGINPRRSSAAATATTHTAACAATVATCATAGTVASCAGSIDLVSVRQPVEVQHPGTTGHTRRPAAGIPLGGASLLVGGARNRGSACCLARSQGYRTGRPCGQPGAWSAGGFGPPHFCGNRRGSCCRRNIPDLEPRLRSPPARARHSPLPTKSCTRMHRRRPAHRNSFTILDKDLPRTSHRPPQRQRRVGSASWRVGSASWQVGSASWRVGSASGSFPKGPERLGLSLTGLPSASVKHAIACGHCALVKLTTRCGWCADAC